MFRILRSRCSPGLSSLPLVPSRVRRDAHPMASRGGGGADQTAPSRAASASMSLGALSVLDASLVRERDELALPVVDEDPEDPVSPGDGSVFERDYYELRLSALRRHQGRQPLRVQDVKVSIDLVHDIERHRMDLLQSE